MGIDRRDQGRPSEYRYVDGDGWVDCACGRRHWGVNGAAGMLLLDRDGRVLLQHRALWSHEGGTWGLPGGARQSTESALQAALRESEEEAGVEPGLVLPLASMVLDHGPWSYTTVLARTLGEVDARVTDSESQEVSWILPQEVANRALLTAFGEAWPILCTMIDARLTLVIDAANVIGARPFRYVSHGWWTDRLGAARGLHLDLNELVSAGVPGDLVGLPGDTWWPRIIMVVEGESRPFLSEVGGLVGSVRSAEVVAAPGQGDDEVVRQIESADHGGHVAVPGDGTDHISASPGTVIAVTSDRDLRARVARAGGRSIGIVEWDRLLGAHGLAAQQHPATESYEYGE